MGALLRRVHPERVVQTHQDSLPDDATRVFETIERTYVEDASRLGGHCSLSVERLGIGDFALQFLWGARVKISRRPPLQSFEGEATYLQRAFRGFGLSGCADLCARQFLKCRRQKHLLASFGATTNWVWLGLIFNWNALAFLPSC